jgi:hypothetical protein
MSASRILIPKLKKTKMTQNGIVRDTLGRRVVLLYDRDAQRKTLVKTVLQAFQEMGASDDEIVTERMRFNTDNNHFTKWVVSLPDWHDAAVYITD